MSTDVATSRPLIAVSGPSGSGKTSLVDAASLRAGAQLARPRSYTTRRRRRGEGDDEYLFVERAEFERLFASGAIINKDDVYGNLYGISRESLDRVYASGALPIKEIHPSNVEKLSSLGHLVLCVALKATHEELAHEVRLGTVDPDRVMRDTALPSDLPDCYRLVLRRSDGDVGVLADRINRWVQATHHLLTIDPNFVLRARRILERSKAGYDGVAGEFTDDHRVTTRFFHRLSEPFWRTVLNTRPQLGRAYLEIGPGRGWLRSLGWTPGAAYRGLEISEKMRELSVDADLISVAPADATDFANESFHGLFGSLLDPCLLPGFLLEAQRLLVPGGWFAGTAPARDWSSRLRGHADAMSTTFVLSSGSSVQVPSFCYTVDELRKMLDIVGFDIVNVEELTVNRTAEDIPPAVGAAIGQEPSVPILVTWDARRRDREETGTGA